MRRRLLFLCSLTALLAVVLPLHSAPLARHTRLVRSEPAADSTLRQAPTAIQLWFNEAVPLAATRVRLLDAAGTAVALAPLRRDSASASQPVSAALSTALANGSYRVEWVTASRDGHAVSGRFAFTVRVAP
jgi:methionine-rich copper-binding protein CopC